MVLITVLRKLYRELHSVIQTSPELSTLFPSLASAHTALIAAAVATSPAPAGSEPGVAVLNPVPDPTMAEEAAQMPAGHPSPEKPLINKTLQMTGTYASPLISSIAVCSRDDVWWHAESHPL